VGRLTTRAESASASRNCRGVATMDHPVTSAFRPLLVSKPHETGSSWVFPVMVWSSRARGGSQMAPGGRP
jgi:hypothetical protein